MWPLYERDARKAAETVSAETVLARHGAASTMSREELRAKNANPGGDEQHREPGEHGGEHAGDGPPVGVLDRPGRTPGRTASTGVGRGPSGGGEHAKVAWGKGEEMEEGNEEEDDDDVEEFIEIKNAVEQIMEVKVHQRREVQGRFLKDVAQLLIYALFLVLFSVNQWYNPNTYQLYKIKSIVSQSFTDGPYKLSDVSSIRGIYDFLQFTVVPAVATQNMTLLDARCTADGRHQNTQCLEDPFAAEALCCYIQQPNEGLFSSGGHSKNILVTPVKVRQQRVMPQTVKTPVGEVTRWPMLTAKTEETRDGGGTVLDQDPDGFMLDWPSTAPWFKYQTCTGEEACTRDDRLGDRKIQVSAQLPVYTQSGYIAMLEGSAETMITELSKMKKFRFLGGSTRAVFVDFTAYFPGESLYCTVSILFEIGSADVFVSPTLSVRVSDLRQATDQWVWRIVDYVVFLVALLLFVLDAYKFAKNPREFLQDLWNYISIINYVMFAYSFYLVSKLDYTLGQGPPVGIQGLTPMSDAAGSLNWVYWMMRMDKYYDVASGNCIPSWMRMIRYLEQMSPSYKQVVNTITASFNDLVTFLVLMMILVLGFAQAFNLQFGLQVREYSSLTLSINALFRTALGDFDYETLDRASPYMAGVYFLMFFFIVILMMINMILGIIIKTYDTVAAQLAIKAKTEVTGWSMLQQSVGALIKMISVRTLDELKRVSPADNQSMSHMYVVRQDIFDREYLTEPEFRMLFADDKAALDRMGVKSVQELVMYADVTGKPRLDMREVHSFVESLHQVGGKKKKSEKENFVSKSKKFAPGQLSQMRQTMEGYMKQALEENVRMLKTYIHNQLAQATLVLAGTSDAELLETEIMSQYGKVAQMPSHTHTPIPNPHAPAGGTGTGGLRENRPDAEAGAGAGLRSSAVLRAGARGEGQAEGRGRGAGGWDRELDQKLLSRLLMDTKGS